MEEIFKHTVKIQPRFNDFDIMGHVNNALYFSYFDIGKTGYFKKVWGRYINWREVGLVIAHVESDFLSQIVMNEPISVQTTVSKIGNRSLRLAQRIINTTTKEVKATCETVMVGFDIDENRVDSITARCVGAISDYEGKVYKRD